MGIGVSLILIAVGAILTWAVETSVSGLDINAVGRDPDDRRARGLRALAGVLVDLVGPGVLPPHGGVAPGRHGSGAWSSSRIPQTR